MADSGNAMLIVADKASAVIFGCADLHVRLKLFMQYFLLCFLRELRIVQTTRRVRLVIVWNFIVGGPKCLTAM